MRNTREHEEIVGRRGPSRRHTGEVIAIIPDVWFGLDSSFSRNAEPGSDAEVR